jgi:hypothetical protein
MVSEQLFGEKRFQEDRAQYVQECIPALEPEKVQLGLAAVLLIETSCFEFLGKHIWSNL